MGRVGEYWTVECVSEKWSRGGLKWIVIPATLTWKRHDEQDMVQEKRLPSDNLGYRGDGQTNMH